MTHIVDIIDDDDAVRDSMRALLESHGYSVREFASAEAFLHLEGGKAICLLVDHHMPHLAGLDLLERLRAKGDHTPALVVTARSDAAIPLRAARIGVKVLYKPYLEEQLVGWIGHVLETKDAPSRDRRETDRHSASD